MLPEVERFSKWLRRKSPNSSTYVHYTGDVRRFFLFLDKPPDQVSVRDVDRYIEHCQQQNFAIATINRKLASIRSFYHFLSMDTDANLPNPVIPKRHFIRLGRRLPRDAQDAEVDTLLKVIASPRDRAIFLLMLRCGLRVGEVRNLSMEDVYFKPSAGSLPRLWLHGKGGVERVVYLSHQALAALEVWLHLRPVSANDAVFLNRFGRRLTVTGIQLRLAAYCHEAGIWITCHQLRHTFGRHLVEARVPVTTIQRLLGHARIRTTELYMHVSDQQVQADYEAAMAQITAGNLPKGGR